MKNRREREPEHYSGIYSARDETRNLILESSMLAAGGRFVVVLRFSFIYFHKGRRQTLEEDKGRREKKALLTSGL